MRRTKACRISRRTDVELEHFKRHVAPAPANPLPQSEHAFERAVRVALGDIRARFLEALEAGGGTEQPRPPSVSAVLRLAARGRTQLYTRYSHLVDEIKAVQGELDALTRRRRHASPGTKAELVARLHEARLDHERRLATLASVQLTELMRRLGSASRTRQQLAVENAALKEQVAELERRVGRQAENIRQMIAHSNKRR